MMSSENRFPLFGIMLYGARSLGDIELALYLFVPAHDLIQRVGAFLDHAPELYHAKRIKVRDQKMRQKKELELLDKPQ